MEKKRVVRKVANKIEGFVAKPLANIPESEKPAYLQAMLDDLILWESTVKTASETLKQKKEQAVKLLAEANEKTVISEGGQVTLVAPEQKVFDEAKVLDSLTAKERLGLTTFKFDPKKFQTLVDTGAIPSVYAELAKVETLDTSKLSDAMTKDPALVNRLTDFVEIVKKAPYVKITIQKQD